MRIIADGLTAVPIGRRGENAVTEIAFSRYEDFNAQVSFLRPGAQDPYPVTPTIDGDFIIWTISNVDTAEAGSGKVEVVFFEGDKVKKTQTYLTLCANTLGPVGEVPDPLESWYQDILRAAAEAIRGAADSEGYADESKSHADDAAGSATEATAQADRSISAAALATESAIAAQRSANSAEVYAAEARSEADRAGTTAGNIRTEYNAAFTSFKNEYTADFNDAKVDIIHYRDDAEASAQRAEQSATRAEQDYSTLDAKKMELVEVIYDKRNNILRLNGSVATFTELKALVEDKKKYVVVNHEDNFYYLSWIATDSIEWANVFVSDGYAWDERIIINDANEVKYTYIKNPKFDDLDKKAEVFTATYGVTTYAEIKTAYDSGKIVFAVRNDTTIVIMPLVRIDDTYAYFGEIYNGNILYYNVHKTSGWQQGSLARVISLNSASNSQYPTAKAVTDYIDSHNVTLTQAEYDALTTKDPKTEYNIVEE